MIFAFIGVFLLHRLQFLVSLECTGHYILYKSDVQTLCNSQETSAVHVSLQKMVQIATFDKYIMVI